ncbi:hypothetical protein [Bartonella harrusi]
MIVRFDPDHLHQDLRVYDLNKKFIRRRTGRKK